MKSTYTVFTLSMYTYHEFVNVSIIIKYTLTMFV